MPCVSSVGNTAYLSGVSSVCIQMAWLYRTVDGGRERLGMGLCTLRGLHLLTAALHAASAIVIAILTDPDNTVPIFTNYSNGGRGDTLPPMAPVQRFVGNVAVGYLASVFQFLAAADHTLTATCLWDWYQGRYKAGLGDLRWAEYSLSASLMKVQIAMLCGVSDAYTLFAIAALTACMVMFAPAQERACRTDGQPKYALLAGFVPWAAGWVVILAHFAAAVHESDPPWFVSVIVGAMLVLDLSFAVLFAISQGGGCVDRCGHTVVEVGFVGLSLTSKFLLAWLVYGGSASL